MPKHNKQPDHAGEKVTGEVMAFVNDHYLAGRGLQWIQDQVGRSDHAVDHIPHDLVTNFQGYWLEDKQRYARQAPWIKLLSATNYRIDQGILHQERHFTRRDLDQAAKLWTNRLEFIKGAAPAVTLEGLESVFYIEIVPTIFWLTYERGQKLIAQVAQGVPFLPRGSGFGLTVKPS